MCGLAGYFGRFPHERLEAMSALVAHRGPDDSGTWSDPLSGVGLALRRLSILDLRPEGRQPMPNEDGSVQLVFNGEIYNFQPLREELEAKGHRFRSRTDTEVMVHLYEEEGEGFLRRLNGMFALALWDGRSRSLLLARDPLGIKPLYYCEAEQGLVFASELKALLVHPEVPRELDPVTIHQHLSYIWSAAPRTMLRAVKKLEPGYFLVASEGRVVRRRPYYDLPFDGRRLRAPEAELEERVREALADAVRRQMVSDVPIGAFLSGGVDSSSVASLMRRATQASFPCYTIALAGDVTDENPSDLPFARLVASRLGVELREVRVSPDVVGFTERMVHLLDEPLADPACINVYLIAEQARRDGCKVLLSGVGGDDLFSGYRRHAALYLERYWSWMPRPVRKGAGLAAALLGVATPGLRRARKYFSHAGLEADDRLLAYFLWSTEDVVDRLFAPNVAAALQGHDILEPLRQTLDRIPSEPDPLNRMLYLELKHFLPDHNLTYTDKMSMAQGIEVRVPFLDLDLVDLAARLPPEAKRRGMQAKALLKRAMAPLLPDETLRRAKTGFGAPLRRWLREDLREMVRDTLSQEALERRGLFDPRAVQALIVANERRSIDASYLIFSLMCIEMWMRSFSPPRTASP